MDHMIVVVACAEALMFWLCVWLTCVILWTDGWCDPAVQHQCKWAREGSEGSGGAGSGCEPSHGGSPGLVFGLVVGSIVACACWCCCGALVCECV